MVVRLIVFLSFANLICRSTDISKCFSESLGIRDNESRLYIVLAVTNWRMSQTSAGILTNNDKVPTRLDSLERNLGRIDFFLPCQTDAERVQSELWACFWRTSSVDCNAHWLTAKKSHAVSQIDRVYYRALDSFVTCTGRY